MQLNNKKGTLNSGGFELQAHVTKITSVLMTQKRCPGDFPPRLKYLILPGMINNSIPVLWF